VSNDFPNDFDDFDFLDETKDGVSREDVDDGLSFLDALAEEPEVVVPPKLFRGGSPGGGKSKGMPIDEPGFVPCPNRGSFYAKAVLKALGGHFNWDNKTWYVPVARRDEAFAACAEAHKRNTALVVEEVAHLLGETEAAAVGESRTCWECGGSLYEYPKSPAGATWTGTQQRLKPGALVDEAYCGCVERGDSKRRHRPDFRARSW
jgi:hypothetical protein